MNRILLFLFILQLNSCDYFESKKVFSEDLLEEELKTFNWKDVDEYPSFESCDSISGKANKKHCFESTLRNILNTNLAQHQIIVTEDINDTIQLSITIDQNGRFNIEDIVSAESTRLQIPELHELLRQSLDSLPEIYPAIKRSQPVKTQFNLPVIIKIE